MKRILVYVGIVMLLLVADSSSAQGGSRITRNVVAAGGAVTGRLSGAIGQPVVGVSASSSWATLCSGFWCDEHTSSSHVGRSKMLYRSTFGQAAIMAAFIALIAIMGARWSYDMAHGLWRKV